jgi:integrase
LHAGRTPRPDPQTATVKDVANAFLNAKRALLDAGELSPHTWANYKRAAVTLVEHMGKTRLVADLDPQDFAALRTKMAKPTGKWGPHRLAVTIQHIRSIFKHAFESALIPSPVRFGPGFKGPSKKTFRLHRAKLGAKLFTAEEIRMMFDAAGTSMKAMLLLGINAGFSNSDCANLTRSVLDLDGGWADYARVKTGIPRRCPLWPETVQALRDVLAKRRQPKNEEDADLVFVTKYGLSWGKDTTDNPVSKETAKLLRRLGLNGRKGRGFYTMRHVFRTVADESKDQVAVDHIMGHARDDMASVYRERISDERLRAVAEYVRKWLLPGTSRSQENSPHPSSASSA